MSERAKVLLYTVFTSVLLFVAVERFLGTTDEYASRLDIKNTPQNPNWDPENEIVNARAKVNAPSPVRAEADPNATIEGVPTVTSSEVVGVGEDEEGAPEHDEDEERLTMADARRLDSDGDMEASVIVVAGMSPEESALLERIDGDLLKRRAPTRALDLVLAGCTVQSGVDDDGEALLTVRPNLHVGVLYRHGSVAIKGASLNRIDSLIDRFRSCDSALLFARPNPEGRVDVNDDARLISRREEELKYYLLQRRVPDDRLRFPENS